MDAQTQTTDKQEPLRLEVVDRSRTPVETIEVNPAVFGAQIKPHLLHEVVVYQEAKHRAGTASTKTRGEVTGSTRKPWRQKGTGRARAGERKSPLWRKGGIIFGPKPRDYSFRVPKKVRKAALRSALSAKREQGQLLVVDEIKLERIKTKELLAWLKDLEIGENALLVIPGPDEKVELSARNLPRIKVLRAEGLNVRDLLLYKRLVMTKEAIRKVEEALS